MDCRLGGSKEEKKIDWDLVWIGANPLSPKMCLNLNLFFFHPISIHQFESVPVPFLGPFFGYCGPRGQFQGF